MGRASRESSSLAQAVLVLPLPPVTYNFPNAFIGRMSHFQRDQKHFGAETLMEVWVLQCCMSCKHSCSHRLPLASLHHVPPVSAGRRSSGFHQEEQLQTDDCKQLVCGQRLLSFFLASGAQDCGSCAGVFRHCYFKEQHGIGRAGPCHRKSCVSDLLPTGW